MTMQAVKELFSKKIHEAFYTLDRDYTDMAFADLFAFGCHCVIDGNPERGQRLIKVALIAKEVEDFKEVLDFAVSNPRVALEAAKPNSELLS